MGLYNNIKAKERTADELQKQLSQSTKCLRLIAENALRSLETNSLIPALLLCHRNIVCLVLGFRWRQEKEILQWNYVPFTEGFSCNCDVIFLYYKGNQQNMLGILEITQREPSIYSINNYVVSCAYLCATAVCFSFAWGHTTSPYLEVQDLILHSTGSCHHWDYWDVKQMPPNFAEQRTENWTACKRKPLVGRNYESKSTSVWPYTLRSCNL